MRPDFRALGSVHDERDGVVRLHLQKGSCVRETVNGPDVGADFTGVSNVPLMQRHGYV